MRPAEDDPLSLVLEAVREGHADADQRLFELVYAELRTMAHQRLFREQSNSMATNSMVHEAYLRLTKGQAQQWENRRHFFGAASRAMRQIILDRARKRRSVRHGGEFRQVTLGDFGEISAPEDLLALDEALERLERELPRHAEVIQYRHFLGLTVKETATLLDVSERTVASDWEFAKAWLKREMTSRDSEV